ncbi:probable serine/threonine-protein phosphatase 2A regulatory subunit B'' subunit TON2 [Tanacetum coccineum]
MQSKLEQLLNEEKAAREKAETDAKQEQTKSKAQSCPSNFMKFEKDKSRRIAILPFYLYVMHTVFLTQARIDTSELDVDSDGFLQHHEMEAYIRGLIPDLAQLCDTPTYCLLSQQHWIRYKHSSSDCCRQMGTQCDSRVLIVYRNEKWTCVEGTNLVPGDIASIGRFVRQDTETEESIPADMLILEGSLIVSKSTLTDESVPQHKALIFFHFPSRQRTKDQGVDLKKINSELEMMVHNGDDVRSLDESVEEESESSDSDYDSVIKRAIAKKYGKGMTGKLKSSRKKRDDDDSNEDDYSKDKKKRGRQIRDV